MISNGRFVASSWFGVGLTYHYEYIHNMICGKLKNTAGWINSFPALFPPRF